MSAHTPGFWILEQDTVFIGETRKVQPVLYHGDSEGMANARLIATAPELLSALECIAQEYAALMRSQGAADDIGGPASPFTAGTWAASRLASPIAKANELLARLKGGAE